MSAIGTKRTWASALHMSAFGQERTLTGFRDETLCLLLTQSGR
jgi:hypothetical protein